ncbi:MAG TPA: 50S ribosomal protein L11 methyltransferase [Burkholderiales bacterium]|nr:50S ribosomal protein L11 methyltransferase [Burkholderiales bacterium]
MAWVAIELEVDAPQAGPMSDALLELGAQSVTIEDANAATEHESALFAEPGTDAADAWPRNRLSALFAARTDPAALLGAAAQAAGLRVPPACRIAQIEDEDWVRRTQSQFAPLRIGETLWIVPSWCAPPAEEGAVVVRLDPGLAFGTGSHPTTRLVLRWLERILRGAQEKAAPPRRPCRVLDYGCGSGILALAAAKLGASEIVAIDVDSQAREACAANARANDVALQVAPPDALPAGAYDVIAANILAQPLIALAPLFAARARAGARIALSGILESQAAEVVAAYGSAFDLGVERIEDRWALLTGIRR